MPINTEKIKKEFSKGSIDELVKAFYEVKTFVAELVEIAQKQADEKASQLQSEYERINS